MGPCGSKRLYQTLHTHRFVVRRNRRVSLGENALKISHVHDYRSPPRLRSHWPNRHQEIVREPSEWTFWTLRVWVLFELFPLDVLGQRLKIRPVLGDPRRYGNVDIKRDPQALLNEVSASQTIYERVSYE